MPSRSIMQAARAGRRLLSSCRICDLDAVARQIVGLLGPRPRSDLNSNNDDLKTSATD